MRRPNPGPRVSRPRMESVQASCRTGEDQSQGGQGALRSVMATIAEVNSSDPLIVQLLLDRGVLDSRKLETLREVRAKDGGTLEGILIKKGLASDHDIAKVYSEYFLIPLFDPAAERPPLDQAL